MAEVLRQALRNFSWPYEALKKQKPTVPASEHVKPSDVLQGSLFWLVQKMADRRAPNEAPFDTNKITKALQARLAGGELNLCNLDAEQKSFFEAFTLEDWKQLQVATTLHGAIGIAYIELEAELFDRVQPGLQALSNLDCISVWAPPEGGDVDFDMLKGANGPLRINILGTPKKPLKITVPEWATVEGKESQNRAIQNSVFHTRDASGQVSAESTPLPLARPLLAPAHPLQDAGPDDLSIGLKTLMRCGTFDASGKFGIDLKNLLPEQVQLIQALGDRLWGVMEADAKRAGLRISWVQLHRDLRIDLALMPSLKKLSSFVTISVATPPPGTIEDHRDHTSHDLPDLPRLASRPRESQTEAAFNDVRSAAKSLMHCTSFDARGQLGLDSTTFSKEQARGLQSLGPELWTALQTEARKAGLEINWLRLHDDFIISRPLLLGLKQIKSLHSLSVATPARGMLLNLSQSQGGPLRDVEVRCAPGRKWAIIVPEGVNVRPSSEADDADPALKQSKVHYEKDGKVIRETPLF
jgi:hypothetical protein